MWYSLLPDQLVSAHACTTLPNACAGAGVAIASTSKEEPFLTVSAKKQIALFDGPDTVLRATANVDFEPRTSKFSRRAGVRISRRFLNFTERQDLQLAAGLDVDWTTAPRTASKSSIKPVSAQLLLPATIAFINVQLL
eukprot:jgi/Chrzof1/6386/Cz18g08120.t1